MSAGESFAVAANRRQVALQDQCDALADLAALDTSAGEAPMHRTARERGGLMLDPVDPTMAVAPVVWLRALVTHARIEGRKQITGSEALRGLVVAYEEMRRDEDAWAKFEQRYPIGSALRRFLGTAL